MSRTRAELRCLLELAALTGLALVQPVLDVLGRSPETFVFRRVDGPELVFFAAMVALAPAVVLWVVGLLSGLLGPRVRRTVHVASLAGLAGLAALVALKSADALFGSSAFLVAVVVGAAVALAYQRFVIVRTFLAYLSALPVLAVGSFLFVSPASGLVGGADYDIVDDPGTTTPLVVLLVDELPTAELLDREGGVDAERFPNFARLAGEARWYRNYTTVNNFTVHAVPAMLSGEVPDSHDVPLLDDHPRNLFTLLGGTYDFNVSEAITQLCPAELCPAEQHRDASSGLRGISQDTVDVIRDLVSLDDYPVPETDYFVEPVTGPSDETFEPGSEAEVEPTRFRTFLDALGTTTRPGLHYLHLVLPHEPWRFFPDGTEYAPPARDPRGDPLGRWSGAWPARLGRFRFELQARYVDSLLGRMIERLEETGLWDDAVIAVVADHGASFLSGQGRRVLTEENAHEIMWSALLIRAPGLEQGTTDVNMVSTDLLPTLADLIGADLPWEGDGRSILAVDDGSVASTTGDKVYHRFTNRHFYEPEAELQIDSASNLRRLLTQHRPHFDAADPVGSLYVSTRHGDLYDQPIEALTVGPPVAATASVEGLDDLLEGGLPVLAAYVGGGIESLAVPDDAWVVATVDGVVSGMSPLFREERHRRGFYLLLDQDRVDPDGTDVELYVVENRGGPLLPIEARDE